MTLLFLITTVLFAGLSAYYFFKCKEFIKAFTNVSNTFQHVIELQEIKRIDKNSYYIVGGGVTGFYVSVYSCPHCSKVSFYIGLANSKNEYLTCVNCNKVVAPMPYFEEIIEKQLSECKQLLEGPKNAGKSSREPWDPVANKSTSR